MTSNDQDRSEDAMPSRFRVVVFACHRVAPATEGAAWWPEGAEDFEWRIIRQPCSGKIQVAHLLRTLEEGVDGVCVASCPEEDCKFLDGSRRARKRLERVQSLLEEIGLGGNRAILIHVVPCGGRGLFEEQVLAAAQRFEALGPSPLRKQ